MAIDGEGEGDELPAFGDYAKATPRVSSLTEDEKQWGMYCHLSALLGLAVVGLMFLGPLLCWRLKRQTSRFVEDQAKEALNFQLNIFVLYLVSILIVLLTDPYVLILTIVLLIYGGAMAVIAGMKVGDGVAFRYPAIVRVIN